MEDQFRLLTAMSEVSHGPFLRGHICSRTFGDDVPLLFEIKSQLTASELQCAVGQLFIFGRLLGREYRKVLVLPKELSPAVGVAIKQLGLEVLTWREHGARFEIDAQALENLTE